MIIIMLGAPGTGKGTVGSLLSEKLNIPHISSGEIFRSYIKKCDNLGREIEEYISKGVLVPDELAIKIIEKRLSEPDTKNGMILDGYPRNINQAIQLDKLLDSNNKKIDIAVDLSLPDNQIIDRIVKRRTCINPHCRQIYNLEFKPPKNEGICDKCGSRLVQRTDDNEQTVKARLKVYHEISENLLNYYKKKDILYTVKLNNESNITTNDVVREVEEYLRRSDK